MMSRDDDEDGSEPDPTSMSAVGYGKPPTEHRFQKGKSGNPAGRPRKQRTPAPTIPMEISDLLKAEARRPLTVRENNKETKMSAFKAVLRAQYVAALKGNTRAQTAIIKSMAASEEAERELSLKHFGGSIKYKEHYKELFEDYDRRGKKRPDVVPHPDEMTIDMNNCDVIYNGPMDEIERAWWKKLQVTREQASKDLASLEQDEKDGLVDSEEFSTAKRILHTTIIVVDCYIPSVEMRRTPGFNIHKWREQNFRKPENASVMDDFMRNEKNKKFREWVRKIRNF